MIGWLCEAYPWVKAAHLIVVIFWLAGLFMLPRFLVYHQEAALGTSEDKAWVDRERRLIRIILQPAMVAVWALGFALVLNIGASGETWFRIKFLIVVLLTVYQFWMVAYAAKLARGIRSVSGKRLRLLNEVPGVVTIAVVILAIVKPTLT